MGVNILNIDRLKEGLLMKAIEELNTELVKRDIQPITLNVIGGFALMIQEVRKDINAVTDVDYIGDNLPDQIEKISNRIGVKYGLGQHWINNDVLLSGTSLEDIEYSTGKLHFTNACQLDRIKINVLDKKDLLRMKVIAIDTSLSAVDFGGEFTRVKDFEDIKKLMDSLDIGPIELEEECGDYMLSDYTLDIVNLYMEAGLDAVNEFLEAKCSGIDLAENEEDLMQLYDELIDTYGKNF